MSTLQEQAKALLETVDAAEVDPRQSKSTRMRSFKHVKLVP